YLYHFEFTPYLYSTLFKYIFYKYFGSDYEKYENENNTASPLSSLIRRTQKWRRRDSDGMERR
uniref:Uncharacterized protein n=1 Tax=Oryza brachyantha TaxID=4533 RepID=J3NC11_ORYBR